MSKMREAFEKSIVDYGYSIERESDNPELYLHTCTVDAWIGYQDAIAAIREGGPAAWIDDEGTLTFKHNWLAKKGTNLYKLPEDLL